MEVEENASVPEDILGSEVDEVARQLELSIMLSQEADWSNMSQGRVDLLRGITLRYLQGDCSESALMELQQNKLTVILCKEHLQKLMNENNALDQDLAALHTRASGEFSSFSGSPDASFTSQELGKKRSSTSKVSNRSKSSDHQGSIVSQSKQSKLHLKKASKSSITKTLSSNKMKQIKESEGEMLIDDGSKTAPEELKLPQKKIPSHAESWEKFTAGKFINVTEHLTAAARVTTELHRATELYKEASSELMKARHALQIRHQMAVMNRRKSLLQRMGTSSFGLLASRGGDNTSDSSSNAETSTSRRLSPAKIEIDAAISNYGTERRLSARLVEQQRSNVRKLSFKHVDENNVEMNEKKETLKAAKVHLDDCKSRLDSLKQRIEDCFEEFCLRKYGAPVPEIEEPANMQQFLDKEDLSNDNPSGIYDSLRKQILLDSRNIKMMRVTTEVFHLP